MTPSSVSDDNLPHRRADFATLAEALDYAARGDAGFGFFNARGQQTAALSYRDLRAQALVLARKMLGAGLAREDRVLLLADTDPDFIRVFFACQYAGLLPVPVSLPVGLGAKDAYIEQLQRQIDGSGAVAAIGPAELVGFLEQAAAGRGLRLVGAASMLDALADGGAEPVPFAADERCYLQFSSGSTRFPLGVDITQRALAANLYGISNHGLQIGPEDRSVSWLPLYHDMGLIGFVLAPLVNQRPSDLMPTREFARRPLTWLTLMSRQGGTMSYSPTFGYDLCLRRVDAATVAALDLSRWRSAGIGGDMIQPDVLRRFAETFAASGFKPEAFVPSYGMAETCVAVSFTPPRRGVTVDPVLRDALGEEEVARPAPPDAAPEKVRDFVICGPALPGHRLEVRDAAGRKLPERRLGRIFVQGPSVMAGYFNQPEATAQVLGADGWLDTGDLGYLVEGEVVITGRAKDLIIVNGRNIWPQDLEWAVEQLPGLRRGDAAAFSLETGTPAEQVVVLVQCRLTAPDDREALRRDVAGRVRETAAIEAEVVLISPKGLPQTSSGKLSRSRAKSNYLAGLYAGTGGNGASGDEAE